MLDSVFCDPILDFVRSKSEMASKPEGWDRIVVPAAGSPVDEGFGDMHQGRDLVDAEVAAVWEQSELALALLP